MIPHNYIGNDGDTGKIRGCFCFEGGKIMSWALKKYGLQVKIGNIFCFCLLFASEKVFLDRELIIFFPGRPRANELDLWLR